MGYRRNEEPVGHTCPKIDRVISFLKSVEWDDDAAFHDGDTRQMIDVMEQIRSDNGKLRDWGNELCEKRDDLEDEIKDQARKIEDLESEVKSLSRENDELKKDIEELENQLPA